MSRGFVASFFPAVSQLLLTHGSGLYTTLFPLHALENCPEVVLRVPGDYAIRNPVLLLWAAAGAGLGLHQGAVLWNQPQRRRRQIWAAAFLAFGLMNVAAIPLHSLLPVAPPVLLPQQYPLLWILDTFFTGCSSAALVAACRQEYARRRGEALRDALPEWLAWNVIGGMSAILSFVGWNATLPLELWYLLPLLMAAAALLPLLIRDCVDPHRSGLPLAICVTAGALVVGGLAVDARLCQSQQVLLDGLRAPAVAFGACDLAFYGLRRWLSHRIDVEKGL